MQNPQSVSCQGSDLPNLNMEKNMAIERTLAIIKPNAIQAGQVGLIINEIERAGLILKGMRLARLTPELCKEFYQEHVGKGFYPDLEAFMVEGPVVLMCLEGEDGILLWRDLMGATDPAKAAPGTIRRELGTSIQYNCTHGSDAPATAAFEIAYFFSGLELI